MLQGARAMYYAPHAGGHPIDLLDNLKPLSTVRQKAARSAGRFEAMSWNGSVTSGDAFSSSTQDTSKFPSDPMVHLWLSGATDSGGTADIRQPFTIANSAGSGNAYLNFTWSHTSAASSNAWSYNGTVWVLNKYTNIIPAHTPTLIATAVKSSTAWTRYLNGVEEATTNVTHTLNSSKSTHFSLLSGITSGSPASFWSGSILLCSLHSAAETIGPDALAWAMYDPATRWSWLEEYGRTTYFIPAAAPGGTNYFKHRPLMMAGVGA